MTEPSTDRTRVNRLPGRGDYDREAVNAILDEALICHVGFIQDDQPFVIPTIHARDGGTLYFHGSPASRMLRLMKGGAPVCVTATIIDGIVAARSVFHHSMNYRSAVVLGVARVVEDDDERLHAMERVTEHVLPGRWGEARHPNRVEYKGTLLAAVPIREFSVKARSGPPGDEADDYALPIWAGVIPLALRPGSPVEDPQLPEGVEVSDSVAVFAGRLAPRSAPTT